MTKLHVPPAAECFEREFPALRARILEIAAALDRLERCGGPPADDPRTNLVYRALAILDDGHSGDRAEAVQLVFSRPYDALWRESFQRQPVPAPGRTSGVPTP